MKKKRIMEIVKDMLICIFILIFIHVDNILFFHYTDLIDMIPMISILGVFLISVFTTDYIWGILSCVPTVFMVNYYSVGPAKKFTDFTLESIITGCVFFSVAIITSAITAKMKAEKKIKAEAYAERMRANLMRAVNHDLRTPLTTIYASASAIMENYDSMTLEQRMDLVGDIQHESKSLVRMIENILSVTRINQEGVEIVKTPAVLEELVDSVLIKFRKRFPNVKVEVDIPEEFISIPMDAVLIEQVLLNLMENAVDHAVGMTRIRFGVSVEEDKALFSISDDGCGIPKDKLDKVFDGYLSSVARSDSDDRRNMGIGLSVCAAVIKVHNGQIYARNNADGGAEFCFTLTME